MVILGRVAPARRRSPLEAMADHSVPRARPLPRPAVARLWPLGPLGVLLALAAALVLSPGARQTAHAFLSVFRTAPRQPLAIIDIPLPRPPSGDPQGLTGLVQVELPEGIPVATAHDAQDRVDFNVRTLRRAQAPQVQVFLNKTATIHLNEGALAALLSAALAPGVRLPREAPATLYADIPAAVRQVWSEPAGDITLWIGRPPRLRTATGPPWEEVRERLIQAALLLAPERAQQLQSVRDWDSTLIVPIPPDAAARRVRADSTGDALLIERAGRGTLIWQRFGALHVLDAPLTGRALIRLADSLR